MINFEKVRLHWSVTLEKSRVIRTYLNSKFTLAFLPVVAAAYQIPQNIFQIIANQTAKRAAGSFNADHE